MVSSAVYSLTPWPLTGDAGLAGSTSEILRQTVCRLSPWVVDRVSCAGRPEIAQALGRLIDIVMTLRSPTAGWPFQLALTPETLSPYVSDEVGDLLDSLTAWNPTWMDPGLPHPVLPRVTLPVPSLIPHLLWMLASSGYEVMHLIEGVKARIYSTESEFSVRVIRLVPVLLLTIDDSRYALDLVTQTDPSPSLCLSDTTRLRLLDNDLSSPPMASADLLHQIVELMGQTQPELEKLLVSGHGVMALRPFQTWQPGTLRLHLHLADMGLPEKDADDSQTGGEPGPRDRSQTEAGATAFTLDDFADTLTQDRVMPTDGIFGDWLTFTDDAWVQFFLSSYVQQVMLQHLPQVGPGADTNGDRELAWVKLVYGATGLVHGPNALFKHTFVHDPALVADVWPRLRWYLAQSSERVMQLMGGLPAQVLCPGRGWQQGILYLRSLMRLTTETRTWIIDLGSGRLLPTDPLALPKDAVIETANTADWANHQTMAELAALVQQDLSQYAPALAALATGTSVNLHRLETEKGCQTATLTLSWCFTWAYGGR